MKPTGQIYRWIWLPAALFLTPQSVFAAERAPLDLPVWTVVPFVCLLLAIAFLPLVVPHFWHSNSRKALVSLGLAVPVAGYLLYLEMTGAQKGLEALEHGLLEYGEFIILLAALYTVAGGIVIQGNFRPTPVVNATFLASGAVLANLIGTTGASMLLIRPVLRINQSRLYKRHVPVFFIFMVSNLGGLLTPLGDPPLYIGFLRGVDFFWTLHLWPQWLLANGMILGAFFLWDSLTYWTSEPPTGRAKAQHPGDYAATLSDAYAPTHSASHATEGFRLRGLVNVLLLGGILAAILLRSEEFALGVRAWLNQFFICPDLQVVFPWGGVIVASMALLSVLLTPRALRQANAFDWGPMIEVAVLFAGIFIAMIPALDLLAVHGQQFNLTEPRQFFWLTGALSSFLDNAPTYLTFATLAAGSPNIARLVQLAPQILAAISCGAVFMGAMTYIGNGPNFMVKAIAEENGYPMPSFFGYLVYSCLLLLPTFAVVTVVFF